MASEVPQPPALPVRKTFLDESDDDPFQFQEESDHEEMAILAASESMPDEMDLPPVASSSSQGVPQGPAGNSLLHHQPSSIVHIFAS